MLHILVVALGMALIGLFLIDSYPLTGLTSLGLLIYYTVTRRKRS